MQHNCGNVGGGHLQSLILKLDSAVALTNKNLKKNNGLDYVSTNLRLQMFSELLFRFKVNSIQPKLIPKI